jgi:hypothetical protein
MDGQSLNEEQLQFIRRAIVPLTQNFPNHGEADIALEILHSLKQGVPTSSHPWFNVSTYMQ